MTATITGRLGAGGLVAGTVAAVLVSALTTGTAGAVVGGGAGDGAGSDAGVVAAAARDIGSGLTPVVQSVMSPPRWYRADDGRFHLEYELLLQNTLPLPVDVRSVQVRRVGGGSIERLSGAGLTAAMTLLGGADPATTLPASAAGVVWVDLRLPTRRAIPRAITHRLTIDIGPGLPVGPLLTDTGGRARVAQRPVQVIAPPLRGPRWVAIVGPHRRALQAVDGRLRLSQRFAIDFSARLDRQDRTHVGDSSVSTSYFNYGRPVLAVGAGKVVEAVDRYPNQIPNHKKPVISLDETAGNHVIVKLGKGVFAAYAHLEPGSVRVHPGDRVRAGQVLARLGNSGNTEGPHLHFQLMNRPDFLAADGLPFVLRDFHFDGRTTSLQAFLDADLAGTPVAVDRSHARDVHRRGLSDLDVVSFPHT